MSQAISPTNIRCVTSTDGRDAVAPEATLASSEFLRHPWMMKPYASLYTWVMFAALAPLAWANPVSFKGGYGIMPAYNRDWADLQVNYSVTNRHSVGASGFYRDGKDSSSTFGIGQFNYLLKRWNELDSQANVNLSIGFGGRDDSRRNGALAGYAALEADYETRRLYGQLSAETLQSESAVHFDRYRARIGFTPYVAAFDSLQTWLVLQVDEMPQMSEGTRITPVIRLFIDNVAIECGVSLGGTPFLAGAAHF